MRSIAVVEIDAPREGVAERYADPRNNDKWMTDLERFEALAGDPGMPGSRYRLISDQPHLNFVATVIERRLPESVKVQLDAPSLTVSMHVTFAALPGDRTRLESTEVLKFKGLFGRAMSLFARKSIHATHRQQVNAFKAYAERAHKGVRGLYGFDTPAPRRAAASLRERLADSQDGLR
jgi:uncharacterized membrane protein